MELFLHIMVSIVGLLVAIILCLSYFPLAYRKARRGKRRYIIRETDKVSGKITHHLCTKDFKDLLLALDKEPGYPFSFQVVKEK